MTGPDIPLFKRFKAKWDTLNLNKFVTGISNIDIKNALGNNYNDIVEYAKLKLSTNLIRDDYKELLDLVIIFLGEVPPGGIKFKKPGAYHHARWMAKGIYCLKMYLFRQEFKLTNNEVNSIFHFNLFLIKCYARFWFSAPNANEAPLNDIMFLRTCYEYRTINEMISNSAIQKFLRHLYYLNEECITLALFDNRINEDTKMKMAQKMIAIDDEEDYEREITEKKIILNKEELICLLENDDNNILLKLVNHKSKHFLERFDISIAFLKPHSNIWSNSSEFIEGEKIVSDLKVVNDSAERSIKLMEEFNHKITKDEDQKQFLLKVKDKY